MYLYIHIHTCIHTYMCINCLNFDKMTRCSNSQCNSNSHNSRNCSAKASTTGIGGGEGGVRLFGVRLSDRSFIKKSASMGNLISNHSAAADLPEGYHSDEPALGSAADAAFHRAQRKRGTPWTEEEHRKFLCGLQKLGKGDWRGISRNYVPSRTPTQVASHAQKYFIRQSNTNRRKKRSSLFDMAPDMEAFSSSTPERCSSQPRVINTGNEKQIVSSSHMTEGIDSSLPSLALTLKPAYMPLPFQLWPPNASSHNDDGGQISCPLILKPAPVVQKEPIKETVAIAELNLGGIGTFPVEPSSLSLRLPGDPSINQ